MPSVYYSPGLPHVDFADTKQFAWQEAVEGKAEQIAEEARVLLVGSGSFKPYVQVEADRAQGDMHGMLDNDDWPSLDFIEKGVPVDDQSATRPCPTEPSQRKCHSERFRTVRLPCSCLCSRQEDGFQRITACSTRAISAICRLSSRVTVH